MYEVRVEGGFAAAHRLLHYNGKCERLHGHNYKVRVWARGSTLGEGGMLVDFSLLKSSMAKVLALLDHSDLNELEVFEQDPSAERIAKFIFDSIKAQEPGLPLSAVELFETETSMARYTAD
jgi:6-pyruvoyltetrahydropterin/6-carboxytetrahydropterin synthase